MTGKGDRLISGTERVAGTIIERLAGTDDVHYDTAGERRYHPGRDPSKSVPPAVHSEATGQVVKWVPRQPGHEAAVLPPDAARCSDEDRNTVIAYIERMRTEGYLTDTEAEARADGARQAKTHQELTLLEADLPLSEHRVSREQKPEEKADARIARRKRLLAQYMSYVTCYVVLGCIAAGGIAMIAVAGSSKIVSVPAILIGAIMIFAAVVLAIATGNLHDHFDPVSRIKNLDAEMARDAERQRERQARGAW